MISKIIPLLLVLPTALLAQPLWTNVEVGMSESELRMLYPEQKGRVEYHKGSTELKGFVTVGKCKPDTTVIHESGIVTAVKIEKIAMAGIFTRTCDDDVYAGLLAKYGQPISESSERMNFLDASEWSNRSTIWLVDGIAIRLERGLDMHRSWRLIYKPVSDTSVKASGL